MLSRDSASSELSAHQIKRGKCLDTESWPEGSTFTIKAAALLLGVKSKTIYNLLWKHANQLSRPKYRQLYRHKGDLRNYRILTEADMAFLRACFPVTVK